MSNYTALELIPTWYGKTHIKPSPEELKSIQTAINDIVSNNDYAFWKCVVLLLAEKSEVCDEAQLKKFMKALTDADPSFPLQDNKKLLKTIAGIAINVKLDGAPSKVSYLLALSVKNINFLGQYEGFNDFETSTYADKLIASYSRTSDAGMSNAEDMISDLADAFKDLDDNENGLVNSEIKDIFKILQISLDANKFLAEEVNTLWWIFGEYSSVSKMSFSETGPVKMSFYGPYELSEKVSFSNGFEAAQQYLNKILSVSAGGKPVEKITVYDMVNSFTVDEFKPTFNKVSSKVTTFTPVLFAFQSSLSFNVEDDWSGFFAKHADGADPKKEFTVMAIANQLFHEFLFIKLT